VSLAVTFAETQKLFDALVEALRPIAEAFQQLAQLLAAAFGLPSSTPLPPATLGNRRRKAIRLRWRAAFLRSAH
jgi:hypothetical protein